jgi:hypothetical protein
MKEDKKGIYVLPVTEPRKPAMTPLKSIHLKGMHKLGKVIIARDREFPSFNSVDPDKYVNRMVDYMYDDDRGALLVLLKIFATLPTFMVSWKLSFFDKAAKWPGMAGAPFRMLNIALKGLIFTIYYSDMTADQSIHKKVGYDAKIVS